MGKSQQMRLLFEGASLFFILAEVRPLFKGAFYLGAPII